MLDDTEIAKKAKISPIEDIAGLLGIGSEDLEKYGKYKAKVSPKNLWQKGKKRGSVI